MTFGLELYFREYWQDRRLSFSSHLFGNTSEVAVHASTTGHIWLPDTFLPNAISSINPNSRSISHSSLLRLRKSGYMLYSRRISIEAECPMDLSLYPFDHQICALSIESYGYATNDIVYEWQKRRPVTVSDKLRLPQFNLLRVVTKARNVSLTTGTYSRLECCFVFQRAAGFYYVQIFIPATAIVAMSWLFLWMEDITVWSDMISVILSITFIYYSYNFMVPQVSYVKAVDLYLISCFLFVFGSLIKMTIFTKRSEASEGPSKLQRVQQSIAKLGRRPTNDEENGIAVDSKGPTEEQIHEDATVDKPNATAHPRQLTRQSTGLSIASTRASKGEAVLKNMTTKRTIKAVVVALPVTFVIFGASYFIAYLSLAGQIQIMKRCA